jgi:alkylated DNA repair dioxygenase AlkB
MLLDTEEFLRCVATEGADVSPPPQSRTEASRATATKRDERIPGLIYVPAFLSEAQEAQIVAAIDRGPWRADLRRRVQHFGWRYDYKAREIDSSMRLGPLPEWAMILAKRLNTEGYLPHIPDQVIVNEYVGKQGINRHTDCIPCFDDGVAMLSLLESWEMIFRDDRRGADRKEREKWTKCGFTLLHSPRVHFWLRQLSTGCPFRTADSLL